MNIDLTPVIISSVAGIVLSLLFEYIPFIHDWYNKLLNNYQKLVMLGIMTLVVAVVFGLNCAGWFSSWLPYVSCDKSGFESAVVAWILAVGSNQFTYLISPKRDDRE